MKILLKSQFNEGTRIIEVGVDEAGRGALAGPVTVAACIMPLGFQHELIKDSKLLNKDERQVARQLVLDNAIAWHVEHISNQDIESTNILKATLSGMQTCLDRVWDKTQFEFILIDGNQFHGWRDIPFETIVGGDNKYVSIAAASILAKTERDVLMEKISLEYPEYGWGSNKGYGTKQHRDAIFESGSSPYHRDSFISHMLTKTETLF